ncbi:MAG: multidrug transporter, partial [Pseudomonadota bacterium]
MARRGLPAWLRASDILDLLRLSVPIAVTRMSMMLMSVTDAIVLGQYAPGELPFVLNSWLPIGVGLGAGLGLLLGVQV